MSLTFHQNLCLVKTEALLFGGSWRGSYIFRGEESLRLSSNTILMHSQQLKFSVQLGLLASYVRPLHLWTITFVSANVPQTFETFLITYSEQC